jgi:serine phosphatase RsbU (regulator of sigma subunit)
VTDGITEAADPAGAMFGEGRLADYLASVRPGDTEPLKRLTALVRAFEAGAPPADDVAVMLLAIDPAIGDSAGRDHALPG